MSITVNLHYKGKDGSARAFVDEMISSGTVDYIRSEEGNERYEYFYSQSDPETVLLIDRWKDQAALDRHHALPVMQKIASLREKYDLKMTAERFESGGDIPESDKKFIRK